MTKRGKMEYNDAWWNAILGVDVLVLILIFTALCINLYFFRVSDKDFRTLQISLNITYFVANWIAFSRHVEVYKQVVLEEGFLKSTVSDRGCMLIVAFLLILLAIRYRFNWYKY